MPFDGPLLLRFLDGREWEVAETFVYRHHTVGAIIVPKGFVTDFASVPRIFWRLLPPTGGYGKAAVIHDYLYRTATFPVTRAQADQVFIDAMAESGVAPAVRRTMWSAVRAFGGAVFAAREAGA